LVGEWVIALLLDFSNPEAKKWLEEELQ